MSETNMPADVQRVYDPLWQDIAMLNAKRQVADAWFWDNDALETLRWGAGSAILAVRDSVFHDLIVSVQRLLDPSAQGTHQNLSLERLVEAVRKTEPDAADTLLRELKILRSTHADITTWRNKRSGHRDYATALNANPLPNMSPADVGSAVLDVSEFLNHALQVYDDASTHWEPWVYPEVETLVLRLKRSGVVPEDAET